MTKLSIEDINVINLGRTKYADAWNLQKKYFIQRQEEKICDTLLLTEHEHVYTLGKSSDNNNLLASEEELKKTGVDVFEVDRGGDVTYHGPGQIVGYPILNLNNYKPDIHLYLRNLEEVLIQTLLQFGIKGNREKDFTGVWVNEEKIAAIGVKVSRWITMHGFALNVSTDLKMFNRIIPCGINHKGVTSMERCLNKTIDLEQVANIIVKQFEKIFEKKYYQSTLQNF